MPKSQFNNKKYWYFHWHLIFTVTLYLEYRVAEHIHLLAMSSYWQLHTTTESWLAHADKVLLVISKVLLSLYNAHTKLKHLIFLATTRASCDCDCVSCSLSCRYAGESWSSILDCSMLSLLNLRCSMPISSCSVVVASTNSWNKHLYWVWKRESSPPKWKKVMWQIASPMARTLKKYFLRYRVKAPVASST